MNTSAGVNYWGVRHKASGELMPQARRNRGYSHWNPARPDHPFMGAMAAPRLLVSERQARRVIAMWAANPNGRHASSPDPYTGEWDDDVDFTDDGRTTEDLEIVAMTLVLLDKATEQPV